MPTRTVNSILGLGFHGSVFDCILAESRIGFDDTGKPEGQSVIHTRLRFDLEIAKGLRDRLDAAIQAVTTPPKDQVN